MIGNIADAAAALAADLPLLSTDGTTRTVYAKDGVVYKVDHYECSNEAEWDRYLYLSSILLPDGVALPRTARFDVDGNCIIAMELIEGQRLARCYCFEGATHDDDCLYGDERDKVSDLIYDVFGYNVIRQQESGVLFLIDLADV